MNATNLNRYNKFFNAAVAALDGGFATAAAKKEANSNVSRAYECVRDSVFSALLDAGKNDNALNLAFELRHVKIAAFLEIARGVGYPTVLSGKPRGSARGCRAWNAKRSHVI